MNFLQRNYKKPLFQTLDYEKIMYEYYFYIYSATNGLNLTVFNKLGSFEISSITIVSFRVPVLMSE